MPFNSLNFAFFFVIFSIIYYRISDSENKNWLIIGGSLFVFSFGNLFNLLCLISTVFISYYFLIMIRLKGRSIYLFIGIVIILLQLMATKYAGFLHQFFQIEPNFYNSYFDYLILPIGISFYSLQAIGLLVDVYKNNYQGEIKLKNLCLFLCFFAQSNAGPIHRGNELIPQFIVHHKFEAKNLVLGIKTILLGYFFKLIIADKIALISTPIFSEYLQYDGFILFLTTLLFSLEIYFDFWGYSLIAIGIGKVLGFKINTNFKNPYIAGSFKEFWHRWHITLSHWMRDYIYFPLGGRKQRSYFQFCLVLIITFIISGIWHGITLNFILWGFVHACLYILEDIGTKFRNRYILVTKIRTNIIIRSVRFIVFFVTVSITWLIFRIENFNDLWEIVRRIISISDWSTTNLESTLLSYNNIVYLFLLIVTLTLCHSIFIQEVISKIPISVKEKLTHGIFITITGIVIILLGDIGGKEFLYFRF